MQWINFAQDFDESVMRHGYDHAKYKSNCRNTLHDFSVVSIWPTLSKYILEIAYKRYQK